MESIMKAKIFLLLTIVFSIILLICMFTFNLPIAYVPGNSSLSEFIFYHVLFMVLELTIFTTVFIYMIETLNIHILLSNIELKNI